MSLTVCFVKLNIKSNINNTLLCEHFSISDFFFLFFKELLLYFYCFD